MSRQLFSLISFPASKIPAITLTGAVARQSNVLALHYSLIGDIENIFLPQTSACPSRKDELWKTTCFEFFLAIKDQPHYWEFNLSPSGDWNIYHMDAYYRIGFREETSISQLPFKAEKETGAFALDMTVDLKPILLENVSLEIGVTAIIQTRDGDQTYWALAHPAPQPDFHRRESFILTLARQTHLSLQSARGS